jgi:hypothetical protein
MEPADLLRHACDVLDRLRMTYLVTGSTATIAYGEPRFTNDIDIVVDLSADKVAQLCAAFPSPDFYLSEETVRRAVSRRGQFNVIHPSSGLKVDMMVPTDSPFNRSRFARAKKIRPAPDFDATFSSAEDVILKKMEAYREGGSEKHLRDITGVLKISGAKLERGYIEDWADRLGTAEIWREILKRVGQG